MDELVNERVRLGLTSKNQNRKNFAIGDYELNGDTGRLYALSGERTTAEGIVGLPEQRYFDTPVIGHDRAFDTEVKILESLAQQYNPNRLDTVTDISGSVRLASELNVCLSCAGVIKQFNTMFPNVNVIAETGAYANKLRFPK